MTAAGPPASLDAGTLFASRAIGTLSRAEDGMDPARLCKLQALVSVANSLAAIAALTAERAEGRPAVTDPPPEYAGAGVEPGPEPPATPPPAASTG